MSMAVEKRAINRIFGLQSMKREIQAFIEYVRKHFISIALCNAVFLIIYSTWLFHPEDVHIDTGVFISQPNSTYNWLDIGRPGLILSRMLLGQMHYNPYLATTLGYGFLCLSGAMLGYLAYRCAKSCAPLCNAMGMLVFISPICAELFYFDNQILEIGFTFCLLMIAEALSFFAVLEKKWPILLPTIALLMWVFSSYQTFIILYVTIAVFLYVLLMRRWIVQRECIEKNESVCGGGYYRLPWQVYSSLRFSVIR